MVAEEEVQEVSVPSSWSPTNIIYMTYEGNFQTECASTILEIIPAIQIADTDTTTSSTPSSQSSFLLDKDREVSIVLDQTVMHAQGGGQPTDVGEIIIGVQKQCDDNTSRQDKEDIIDTTVSTVKIQINKVLLDRTTGLVRHYGTIQGGSSNNEIDQLQQLSYYIGSTVQVYVDRDRRQILSECHTAGHVVDAAMVQCGYILQPSKGYHFLDSPYVEYVVPNDKTNTMSDQKDVVQRLQVAFQEFINNDISTQIELLSKEEADIRCNNNSNTEGMKFFDMDAFCTNINDTENNNSNSSSSIVRIVTVAGYPCPCGGTHVSSTGKLRYNQWGITGMKMKKGLVRIKYGQQC